MSSLMVLFFFITSELTLQWTTALVVYEPHGTGSIYHDADDCGVARAAMLKRGQDKHKHKVKV